jgi:hypothetical protein
LQITRRDYDAPFAFGLRETLIQVALNQSVFSLSRHEQNVAEYRGRDLFKNYDGVAGRRVRQSVRRPDLEAVVLALYRDGLPMFWRAEGAILPDIVEFHIFAAAQRYSKKLLICLNVEVHLLPTVSTFRYFCNQNWIQ